jgi:hypothetical protein
MNQIARRIIYDRYRRNFCLNNFTPPGWFECDVFELTRNGFFREYEIKVSRSDFKADKNKVQPRETWAENKWVRLPDRNKHDELAKGSPKGPSRFYFVTPAGLIEPHEIPQWAGLMQWRENDSGWEAKSPRYITIDTIVEAPCLHRCKFTEDRRRKLLETCYWRYHSLSVEQKYPADDQQPVAV